MGDDEEKGRDSVRSDTETPRKPLADNAPEKEWKRQYTYDRDVLQDTWLHGIWRDGICKRRIMIRSPADFAGPRIFVFFPCDLWYYRIIQYEKFFYKEEPACP